MDRTPQSTLKASVSCESIDAPEGHPVIERRPPMRNIGGTSKASAEPADPEYGHHVSGPRSAVAQGVEGGDPGAHQRAGLDRRERLGNQREGPGRSDHVVSVAAVVRDPGYLGGDLARHEVTATAGIAVAAVSSVPADGDPLAGGPPRDVLANSVQDAGDFVSGDARVLEARECPDSPGFRGKPLTY